MNSSLLMTKLIAVASLSTATIFCGLLPSCCFRTNCCTKTTTSTTRHSQIQIGNKCSLFLSCLLCYGGGILIATSFVHILPEARELMPAYLQGYTEMIYCGGFFLLYVLDEIVHFFNRDNHKHTGSEQGNHGLNSHQNQRRSNHRHNNYGSTSSTTTRPVQQTYSNNDDRRNPQFSWNSANFFDRQLPYNPSFSYSNTSTTAMNNKARSESDLLQIHEDHHQHNVLITKTGPTTLSQLCHVADLEPCTSESVVTLGLLLALSVHACLEGLVVGLAKDAEKVWLLLGAVASHKLVVAFCLGAEFVASLRAGLCKNFIYMSIFASGSVIGILLGIAVSDLDLTAPTEVVPVLQAIAGGTLLYVTVSEVLPRERSKWHQKYKFIGLLQCLSVAIGFFTMIFVSGLLGDVPKPK